jgi:hypothetical protein
LAILRDFASRDLNRINRLGVAKIGFGRVVPTLGIFWKRRNRRRAAITFAAIAPFVVCQHCNGACERGHLWTDKYEK